MDEQKEKLEVLVKKYEAVISSGKLNTYSEEDTKKGFIEPLFEILGWDFRDRSETSSEEHIKSSGRVDYGFYLNGRCKFYLEAKPLKADLNKEEYAKQAIKYSWNKGITWAVLTDFETVKVFNSQDIEGSLGAKLFFQISYSEYLSRFDQLWLLSKESFTQDLLDKEAEKFGKKLQRIPISTVLSKDLDRCREILTRELSAWNPNVKPALLDEGVQKLLDRLIFLRVAEDRGIEPPTVDSRRN